MSVSLRNLVGGTEPGHVLMELFRVANDWGLIVHIAYIDLLYNSRTSPSDWDVESLRGGEFKHQSASNLMMPS